MQFTNNSLRWVAWGMAAALWSAATTMHAALITFSFDGASGAVTSFAPDAQPPGATASNLTRGSGLSAASATGAFNASGWTTGAARDINDYFSFSVIPDADHLLALTRLEFDLQRSSNGPQSWSVYSSRDDFANSLATISLPSVGTFETDKTVLLGSAFGSITTSVEFRIYGFGATTASGTGRIDNVELFGSVERRQVSVPDAGSSFALLGLALGGLSLVGRRFVR